MMTQAPPVLTFSKAISPTELSFGESRTAVSNVKSDINGITSELPVCQVGTVAPITMMKDVKGNISFRPIEARLNKELDPTGKVDPYCIFKLGAKRQKGFRS